MKTYVIFKKEKDGILAVFPRETGDIDPATISCYCSKTQHSICSYSYVLGLPNAKPDEYVNLFYELERMGYLLTIRSRISRVDHEIRKAKVAIMLLEVK